MLDRNGDWEKYVELIEKLTVHVARVFYIYTSAMGVKGHPKSESERWKGRSIKNTAFRWYYTGGTVCFLEDVVGNRFIGTALCSDQEKSFRKKTGRNASKYRALLAMDLAYEICGSPDQVAVAAVQGNGLKEITILSRSGQKLTGLARSYDNKERQANDPDNAWLGFAGYELLR